MAGAAPPPQAGPGGPSGLSRRSWRRALANTVKEIRRDQVQIWAAALTYYSVRVTVSTTVLLFLSILIVVLSGRLARAVGGDLGVSFAAQTAWRVLKWPVLLILVGVMLSILFWASPNVRQGGFRWITPGGLVAVVLWVLVSAAFAAYTANFGHYVAVYGALGAVVVFLVWLWLSNLAILFGVELDAELERQRAIAAGHPADREPYLQLRDDRELGDDGGFPRSGSG